MKNLYTVLLMTIMNPFIKFFFFKLKREKNTLSIKNIKRKLSQSKKISQEETKKKDGEEIDEIDSIKEILT